MENISLKIGERLKEIRQLRQMTLDDVAKITGVSKPMLGQIERGQSSPTIHTLWKIATGLKIPLSTLCKQQEADYTVVQLDERDAISEEEGAMKAYPLFPYDPVRNVEIFYIEFIPGVEHQLEPHANGVEEYVFVVQGTLALTIGTQQITLIEKQSVRFQADVPHVYYNCSQQRCSVYNMIFYPND